MTNQLTRACLGHLVILSGSEEIMVQTYTASDVPGVVEEVEIQGHIIDSLILPKVLDEILTHGGSYVLKEIRVGQRQTDQSFARIEVRAPTAAALREILDSKIGRAHV